MKDFGKGYRWSSQYLTINKGDYVQWSWSAPGMVTNINYKVEQVSDAASATASGFTSGSPTSTGSFTYQFNKVGTYYYWSGYVDLNKKIAFRGVITVTDAKDNELEIDVFVSDIKGNILTK